MSVYLPRSGVTSQVCTVTLYSLFLTPLNLSQQDEDIYSLFVLMKYGYSQGTHTADNAEPRKDQFSHVLTVCKQTMFWVKGYML